MGQLGEHSSRQEGTLLCTWYNNISEKIKCIGDFGPAFRIVTEIGSLSDNPSKSKIHAVNPTKSKIQDDNPKIPMPEEEDFQDYFDRMCNVKSGFCSK